MNAFYYTLQHYKKESLQHELSDPDLEDFRTTYIRILTQVAFIDPFIDPTEWMRIMSGKGRVVQQCGFLSQYHERFGFNKDYIEKILEQHIKSATDIMESGDILSVTVGMNQPEDRIHQELQRHHIIQQQHLFHNHQIHHNHGYNVHTDADTSGALSHVTQHESRPVFG